MRKCSQLIIAIAVLSAVAFGQAAVLYPNASSTGTTANSTASVNTSGQAVLATTSQTSTPVYIVVGGAGTTGSAALAVAGLSPCTMDSTISSAAAGDYVINSTTTGGDCHAQSTAPSNGVWVIGYLHDSTTTSGSTALVQVNGYSYPGPCTTCATSAAALTSTDIVTGAGGQGVQTPSNSATVDSSGDILGASIDSAGFNPCSDTSGSGTAQSCNTPVTFTPSSDKSCITYTTTTSNTGTNLTVNVNSLGAKNVAIPSSSGWTTTLTVNIIPASKPVPMCYDGTNWDAMQTGTAASSGGGSNTYPITVSGTTTSGAIPYLSNATTQTGNGTLKTDSNSAIYQNTNAIGSGGSSQTISAANGPYQTITLSANLTVSWTQPTLGSTIIRLKITQASSGGPYTVTWNSTKWPGGQVPIMSTAASAVDWYSCLLDGTNTWCTAGQAFQ